MPSTRMRASRPSSSAASSTSSTRPTSPSGSSTDDAAPRAPARSPRDTAARVDRSGSRAPRGGGARRCSCPTNPAHRGRRRVRSDRGAVAGHPARLPALRVAAAGPRPDADADSRGPTAAAGEAADLGRLQRRTAPLRRPSIRTGPMRTRTSRSIGAPTAPNIRRSWRFQPWVRTARYQASRRGAVGGARRAAAPRPRSSGAARELRLPSSSSIPGAGRRPARARAAPQPERVFALDAVARMEDALGPAAVVGQDQQALGVLVEPPDRVQPRAVGDERGRDEVEDGRSACRSRVVEVTPAGLWRSRYAAAPPSR